MEALWPNTAVTDNSLAQCMVEIRRVLDDDSQQLIRTIARHGYLFAAPVGPPVVEFAVQETGAYAELGPLPVAPSVPRGKSLILRIAIGAAGLVAVTAVGLLVWRVPESTEPLRAVPLTTLPGLARYPSFSPEGNHVAFTWTGPKQDNPDIYVQQIGSGSPLQLTQDPGNDYNPVWSPDGRWIAFLRRQWEGGKSELRLVPPLGGPERKLAEILVHDTYFIIPPYLAWCPDSNCLVVADSPGDGKPAALFMVSLDTGERRQLTDPQPPAIGDTNPAVSPTASGWFFAGTLAA